MRQRNARPVVAALAEVRGASQQVELGDDRVVGVMQRDEFVALIRKRSATLGEIGTHRLFTVIYIARRDELIARVPERGDRRVEIMPVLRLHVLPHDGLAACAEIGAGHARKLPARPQPRPLLIRPSATTALHDKRQSAEPAREPSARNSITYHLGHVAIPPWSTDCDGARQALRRSSVEKSTRGPAGNVGRARDAAEFGGKLAARPL